MRSRSLNLSKMLARHSCITSEAVTPRLKSYSSITSSASGVRMRGPCSVAITCGQNSTNSRSSAVAFASRASTSPGCTRSSSGRGQAVATNSAHSTLSRTEPRTGGRRPFVAAGRSPALITPTGGSVPTRPSENVRDLVVVAAAQDWLVSRTLHFAPRCVRFERSEHRVR